MPKNNILWQDRKRILGMPISFTKYRLEEDRLFIETGLLSTKYDELLLYRVRDISLKRTLAQKLLGVGTVVIYSSDSSTPELYLMNIKNAYNVKELIHNQVEQMKTKKRMRFGEYIDGDYADNI